MIIPLFPVTLKMTSRSVTQYFLIRMWWRKKDGMLLEIPVFGNPLPDECPLHSIWGVILPGIFNLYYTLGARMGTIQSSPRIWTEVSIKERDGANSRDQWSIKNVKWCFQISWIKPQIPHPSSPLGAAICWRQIARPLSPSSSVAFHTRDIAHHGLVISIRKK